ncbi:hypothetical protein DFH09DRAFT_1110001 [Mycena vulgaris]|nr:hypothetical protein DFH09DRAFT_1110001 [Mycena vulgaris]
MAWAWLRLAWASGISSPSQSQRSWLGLAWLWLEPKNNFLVRKRISHDEMTRETEDIDGNATLAFHEKVAVTPVIKEGLSLSSCWHIRFRAQFIGTSSRKLPALPPTCGPTGDPISFQDVPSVSGTCTGPLVEDPDKSRTSVFILYAVRWKLLTGSESFLFPSHKTIDLMRGCRILVELHPAPLSEKVPSTQPPASSLGAAYAPFDNLRFFRPQSRTNICDRPEAHQTHQIIGSALEIQGLANHNLAQVASAITDALGAGGLRSHRPAFRVQKQDIFLEDLSRSFRISLGVQSGEISKDISRT